MEIRVKPRVGAPDLSRPLVLPPLDPPSLLSQANGLTPVELSLNEGFDSYGRLIQMVGGNIDPARWNFRYPL